ncbi:MAG TPA: hypothetical protein VEF34_03675, partial [Syntrophobacteraceae bacterium]|nr:hypothetical protein [Syntrophobacteraceae bacterium]
GRTNHHKAISALFPLPHRQSVQGLKQIFITRGGQMSLFINVKPESSFLLISESPLDPGSKTLPG